MKLDSNIKKYYVYRFTRTLTFWLPIFILFFLDRGLSYTQIMTLSVVAAVSQIIFEVPTGIYADYFGRKKALILMAFMKAASLMFYLLGNNFYYYIAGYFLFGVALAFESGSGSAFLYDTLKDLKREREYKKIEGKAFSYSLLGMGTAAFFGGPAATISLELPLLMTILSFILAGFIAFSLVEPKKYTQIKDTTYFTHLKKAVIFAYKHPKVKWFILFSSVMTTAMIVSHKFFQPYMQAAGVDLKYFGVIYLAWLVFSAACSRTTYLIEEKIKEFWSILIIPLLLGFHLIWMGFYVSVYGILIVFLGQFTWGFLDPLIKDYINHHVESYHRATVLSLGGFLRGVLIAPFFPLFGYLADVFSLNTALLVEGIIVVLVGVFLVYKIHKSNSK